MSSSIRDRVRPATTSSAARARRAVVGRGDCQDVWALNPATTDIVKAVPRARRIKIVVSIVIGAAIADLMAMRYGWPGLRDYLAHPDPVEALRRFKRVMAAFGFSMLPMAAVLGMMAGKIIRSRQFPYPGMSVWRDTPIARGRPALVRGWGLAACAALLIGLAIYAAHIPYEVDKNGHARSRPTRPRSAAEDPSLPPHAVLVGSSPSSFYHEIARRLECPRSARVSPANGSAWRSHATARI